VKISLLPADHHPDNLCADDRPYLIPGKESIMAVPTIPPGYHTVTPYLIIKGAAAALDFYKKAFGAVEKMRMPMPDGRVGHAEITVGDSHVMLADEFPEMGHKGPATLGGTSVGLAVYVPDCDAVFARALEAGAKQLKPMQNQFYGDRSGTITDPFGHQWTIATHIEDVSPEEMRRRMDAAMKGSPPC
jgi:PhnB protein